MNELPFQTYERITGRPWPGGRSEVIRILLAVFHIEHKPASIEANLELQHFMLRSEITFKYANMAAFHLVTILESQ
ncbi:MAG TPA: hypothetical protein VL498_06875 [Terracidiphilus sp.]|jgi:hypothetical protein|nr:hypothetical protein [Terracidiphilus sp.]